MTSIRGLLISHMIWKNMNHNAPTKKAFCRKTPLANAIFNKDRLPEAYTWSAETTPGGTAFQRVIRTDTGRTGRVLLYFHGGAYRDGPGAILPQFFHRLFSMQPMAARPFTWLPVRSGLPIPHTIK